MPRAALGFCLANRAENLCYQFSHGQKLLPQFRKIVGLVVRLGGTPTPETKTYSKCSYKRNVRLRIRNTSRNGGEQNKRRAYVTHKPILQRLQQVAIVCLLVFVFLFPTRQKLRFHLSYSRTSSLVFDVREPLCVQYERLRRVVGYYLAHKAWWHNKGTIPIYASADCLPRERRIVL